MNKRVETSEVDNPYVRMARINVSEHIEKKNGLSYLSWTWAIDQLMRQDPMANWEFHEPVLFGKTMMVSCTVTAFGKPIRMHLPVMDHRNKAIENPDAFAINKNMMRCLVKAIACHGLGIYIFAGEDLPEGEAEAFAKKANEKSVTPTAGAMEPFNEDEQKFLADLAGEIQRHFDEGTANSAQLVAMLEGRHLENEEKVAVWSLLDSKVRSSIKKAKELAKDADSVAGQG